jgi:anti-sigma-K factor RskA
MTTRSHDEYQENIGAYLLGALSELEAEVFEQHLAGCAICHDEVARLRVAADALPCSVEPVNPPESLRASLMETVRVEAGEPEAPERPRRSLLRRLLPQVPTMRPAVALVLTAFLVAVGIATGFAAGQLTAGDQSRTVAAAFDSKRVANGTGSLVIPRGDASMATLRLHGMPSLPSNKTYQVWIQRRGEVVPQAIFNVGDDGNALTAVGSDVKDADSVLVTREPAGGARAPSGPPVVRVKL